MRRTDLDIPIDPETVGGTLLAAARTWPDRTALIIGGRQASYCELWEESARLARALMALGVGKGSNIGIYMPNSWDYAVLFHAIAMAGAAAVTLNARFREREVAYALNKADISVLFTTDDAAARFEGRAIVSRALGEKVVDGSPAPRVLVDLGCGEIDGWLSRSALSALCERIPQSEFLRRVSQVGAEDDCLIIFSSGTTADPKACRLSHHALHASADGQAERFRLTERDTFWDPLPFFHMSTMLPMAACRVRGACFIGVCHFEPGSALEELERLRATIAYPAFSTITTSMISHPDFKRRDLTAIRLVLNVGPADLMRKFQAAFPQAVQVACYGLTEAGGLSCYNELTETLDQRVTTCGRPIDGMDIRVQDVESGAIVEPGGKGELQLRGTALFSGYYGDADQTAKAMTGDGWLHPGDIGTLDAEGRVIYLGRLKDMLRVGGENVAASEIESYLATHPAIKLAQVIGVPDDRLEEVPAVFIELERDAALTAREVAEFCAHRIANYKIPRYVRFVGEWPMSATKIQKFQLRDGFVPQDKIDIAALLKATT